jgi:hypothetical protein
MNFTASFESGLGRELARDLEAVRETWHESMERRATDGLTAVSPVDEGEFRDSWEPRQKAEGAITEYRNTAPHAFAIDPGRRTSKKGRMLGSKKAPRGVSYVVGRELGRDAEAVLGEALQKHGAAE